jgi:hypothetical protein
MLKESKAIPAMPEIGRSEEYYAKLLHQTSALGDPLAHHAAKVGQYVSLALAPDLKWENRCKYFSHALRQHCQPPENADDATKAFYASLANLVRGYAGQEALRLACAEDDIYATRLGLGADRDGLESEAEVFFSELLGSGENRPEWFTEEDWVQLRLLRDQWI